MHVAVIGAGASGLAAAKYLLRDEKNRGRFTCEVFERNEAIGGTWFYTDEVETDQYGFPVYACMYQGMKTNLPKEVMGYFDYKFPEQDKSYLSQHEVLAFLNKFADDFNLRPHIKLGTMVKGIRPLPNNRWFIKTIEIRSKRERVKEFDAVIVCSGHFNEGLYPKIPGMELFKGTQMHSHDFRTPDTFRNQNILIIGAGPSGLDITIILSKCAKSITLSHESGVEFTTKFPSNVTLKPNVTHITETGADFLDGTSAAFDTICYCTGYKYSFPFLHDTCNVTIEDFVYVEPLYKQIVNIEHPTMGFIGIPYRACSIPMYDLQIRYYIQYLKGAMKLPSKESMYEDTAQDVARRKKLGYTTKQMHLMSEHFVWDYYQDLSESANIENIWPAITKLRLHCAKEVVEKLLTFRNDKYRIIDKEHYLKIN